MRIAELSRRTGVSIPTIKYYLREGLLSPGERTSRNQADYAETHVRRLNLVRALVDVGGLSIASVRDVLADVDSPDKTTMNVLGTLQRGLANHQDTQDEGWQRARAKVEELIEKRGWYAKVDSPSGRALVAALASLDELGHGDFADTMDTYADACEKIAEAELNYTMRPANIEDMLEGVVIGTVIGDAMLSSIRRLAHQNAAALRLGESKNKC